MKIEISCNAIQRLKRLGKESIYIDFYKGGCAGYMYNFSFLPMSSKSFITESCNGINIKISGTDFFKPTYIFIDYKESIMESKFILNKLSGSFCRCGISFRQ